MTGGAELSVSGRRVLGRGVVLAARPALRAAQERSGCRGARWAEALGWADAKARLLAGLVLGRAAAGGPSGALSPASKHTTTRCGLGPSLLQPSRRE